MVGFGSTGTARADHKGYSDAGGGGTRRTATNRVAFSQMVSSPPFSTVSLIADLDSADSSTPSPYNRDWFGDGGATSNEGGVLGGESGGAWIIDTGGGDLPLG